MSLCVKTCFCVFVYICLNISFPTKTTVLYICPPAGAWQTAPEKGDSVQGNVSISAESQRMMPVDGPLLFARSHIELNDVVLHLGPQWCMTCIFKDFSVFLLAQKSGNVESSWDVRSNAGVVLYLQCQHFVMKRRMRRLTYKYCILIKKCILFSNKTINLLYYFKVILLHFRLIKDTFRENGTGCSIFLN